MKDNGREHFFIERIPNVLKLLDENNLDIEQVISGDWTADHLSPEEARNLRTDCEIIKFIDDIPGGFFIYYAGGDAELIYANKGLLKMFQCETMQELRDLTGNSFRGIVHPDDLEAVEASIQRQIFGSQHDLDYVEYRIRRKDGSTCWVEDYGHFIHGSSKRDIFYVFLGESTDERSQQQMEQKRLLSDALEKANLAVKAKNAFLSHISHEMRTPLNAIFGFTTLAKSNLHDISVVSDYLNQVEKASHQLLSMITQVLDVSALSSAAGPAEVEFDICEIVKAVYNFLMPQAKEKDLAFTLNSDVRHALVYADQSKFKQLVLSLVNNAVTYTPPEGKVSISLTEDDELPNNCSIYRLVVQDNGVGISKEFLERIFEPFSREKTSTLSGVQGIGLGLTIVKSIVDMMDGTIDVESTVNEGSTFTVTFSLRFQPQTTVYGNDIAPSEHSKRILLVEDNEINLEIETELLERMGFIIDSAENGQIVLDKMMLASPGDYDLIIMDLQMPVMNGWQASAAIRKLPDPALANIPIIALSANTMLSDRRKSQEAGINIHLAKPMNLPELLDAIEKLTN